MTSMDVLVATPLEAQESLMPNHQYCDRIPNCVVIGNIWPLLLANIRTISASNLGSSDYLEVLFKLRSLNTEWKWLVDTSTEWAAFRVARCESKGLVRRGASSGFALRHALQAYTNAFSLLSTPRKLVDIVVQHPLIAPFPDIGDRWLSVLKDTLEHARDGMREGDDPRTAYIYIPPELGAIVSKQRLAVGVQLYDSLAMQGRRFNTRPEHGSFDVHVRT